MTQKLTPHAGAADISRGDASQHAQAVNISAIIGWRGLSGQDKAAMHSALPEVYRDTLVVVNPTRLFVLVSCCCVVV